MRVLPSLHFEEMFKWLCSELPLEIPLSKKNMQFLTLIGNTDAKYFEEEETALISDLCMAFYTAAPTAKNSLTKLIPADVRMDKVKENFEARLRDSQQNSPELNARDLELIDEYFRLNS